MSNPADHRVNGFSLIELMVVLAIISLTASLLPTGLQRLYAQVGLDNVALNIATELRKCAARAQLSRQSLLAAAQQQGDCLLTVPHGYRIDFEANHGPEFHADGTSNGNGVLVADSKHALAIKVNRITSSVTVTNNAKP